MSELVFFGATALFDWIGTDVEPSWVALPAQSHDASECKRTVTAANYLDAYSAR